MKHRPRVLLASGTAIAVAAALLVVSPAAAASASVDIDFAVDEGAASRIASGFLHGISGESPDQYLIDGVDVRAIRGADYHPNLPSLYEPATHDRVDATGATQMVGLYYYNADPADPRRSYRPGDDGDWDTWREIVTEVYDEAVAKGYDDDVYSWIPWNEPDLQWNTADRSYARYLETHDVAYDTVKAIDPSLRVQGPELSSFNWDLITRFLTYCKANDCLPDVLSWHELSADVLDVEAHTARIRTWMIDNDIEPMEMAITEYQGGAYGRADAYNVGQNVSWLARMERSEANGLKFGLYSAWEWIGDDPNFVATLGNTTTRSAALPRGVWWNYNTYKEMTGRKVDVTTGGGLDALGATDAELRRATFLVGNQDTTAKEISVTLSNLDSASYLVRDGEVRVVAEAIPNSTQLTAPSVTIDTEVGVVDGTAVLDLPSLGSYGAYRLSVSSATAAAQEITVEAESVPYSATAPAGIRTFEEAVASGGSTVALDATAKDQSAFFTVDVPRAGVYDLTAALKKERSRGVLQLYIDGVAYGQPRDQYGAFDYYDAPFGAIPLDAGENVLEFRTVAKNPASPSYVLTFDAFRLRFLSGAADETAPTIRSFTTPAQPDGVNGWFVSPPQLSAVATDDVPDAPTTITVDTGAGAAPYTGPITIDREGETTATFVGTDAAGNVSTSTSTVKLDTAAPEVTATVDGRTIRLGAEDATSGVGAVEYQLGTGTWTPYTLPVEVGSSSSVLAFRASDAAGNRSTTGKVALPAASTGGVPLAVNARSQCVNGTAAVAVYALNKAELKADIRLTTPFGDKKYSSVESGKAAYALVDSGRTSIEAGTASIAGYTWASGTGSYSTYSAPYGAVTCG